MAKSIWRGLTLNPNPRPDTAASSGIGLYKILFYFEAFVHESIILLLPPPACIARTIAVLLHVY